MEVTWKVLYLLHYNMASIQDEGQAAHGSSGEGALPVEAPVPIAKDTYPGFPYYTCKDGVRWYKEGKGSVQKKEALAEWEKYRNRGYEDGSNNGLPAELPHPESEGGNKEAEGKDANEDDGEEEGARENKKMRAEVQNDEGNGISHEDLEARNKRKGHHKPPPAPEDEFMEGTREIKRATGTKVSVGQAGDRDDSGGGGSEGPSEGNGDGHSDGQANGYRDPYQQSDGRGDGDEDWDPVLEPDGYDPYAPVDFATQTTYYFKKEKNEHWCILPDPGDNKKKKWARAEGRTWGVRKTVIASFHPIPPESKKPRRYYGFKSQEVGNFQTQIPHLLMASVEQLRSYEKEHGTMPFIVGAAWDWDREKEHRELQSNPIRRVVFGPDLTTFGTFDKGPGTHKDHQFTERAWASISTCRAARIKIDAEYASALDRAGQKAPPRMRKTEVRSELQAQGAMIRESSIPRYLMGQEETYPEAYRTGMVPAHWARTLPEAHRAGMLPAPNGAHMDVDSVRSPSRGLSVPLGQYPRDIVELESARSQSREPSASRGQTPLESIENEPVRVQSRQPSVPRGQTPLGTESGSVRSQSDGPSAFSQASTEVGAFRSGSEEEWKQFLEKSVIELLQEASQKPPTGRQVHFEH